MLDEKLNKMIESLEPKGYDLDHLISVFERFKKDLKEGKIKLEEKHMAYTNKETVEVFVFLAKFASVVKLAVDDDGKITLSDAPKFISIIFPLIDAITNIQEVPKEILDLDEAEINALIEAVKPELNNLNINDVKAVESGLKVIFELFNFLKITGAIKPVN